MKVKFYNIKYQFESDLSYQQEYLKDCINSDQVTYSEAYQKEIEYLNTIREVEIEYDDDSFDAFDMHYLHDDLIYDLQNETGEYILDFECDILVD